MNVRSVKTALRRNLGSVRGSCNRFFFSFSSGPVTGGKGPAFHLLPAALCPGAKQLELETDCCEASSSEVQNAWIYRYASLDDGDTSREMRR